MWPFEGNVSNNSTTLSFCVSLVLYSNSKRSTCALCKKASWQCCRFALSCSVKMLNFLFAGCLSALWVKRVGMASFFKNVLLVFEEAHSKKKTKVSSLLHVYLKYFIEQTSYRFVYFYDNTTLHVIIKIKLTCKSLLKQDSSKCKWHIFGSFGKFSLLMFWTHLLFRLPSFGIWKKLTSLSLFFLKVLLLHPTTTHQGIFA